MQRGAGFSGAVRRALLVLLCASAACATTRSADQALREKCGRNIDSDERCVDLLTGSTDTREAEKEVAQAEADRERDEFQARLQRLRDAEEARQATRAKSSTVASADMWEEEDQDAWAEILRAGRSEDEDDGGSSVRALKAGPTRPPPPRPKPPVIRIEAPPPVELVRPDGTPKATTYLDGAKCLLRADLVLVRWTLNSAKKQTGSDDIAGSLALVVLDAEELLARVEAKLATKKRKAEPLCSSDDVRPMIALLRQLVGPRPRPKESGDAYGRGLARLAAELEKRAGLVRPE